MTVRIYREPVSNTVFIAQTGVGAVPVNACQAVGNGDGTISICNRSKEYEDGTNFFETANVAFADYLDEAGDTFGADEPSAVNALNNVLQAAGGSAGVAPVITSALTVNITTGDSLNYTLVATGGVGYRWDNLPAGVTVKEGDPRTIVGGTGLTAGTYSITATATNYYGEDTETVSLVVSAAAFNNTRSVVFNNNDYAAATATTANPFYRASNGSGSGDAWTVAMWVKGYTAGDGGQSLISFGGNDTSNEGRVWIAFDGSKDSIKIKYGTDYNWLKLQTPDNSCPANTWKHVVLTYDGGTTGVASGSISSYFGRFAIYIDGALQTVATGHNNYGFNGSIPAELFYVARRTGGGNYSRGNKIEELALWSSDETANVADIYNSGTPHDLTALTSPPDHYWRMGDGDTFPTLTDNSGSLDLTLYNMTAADIVNDVP